MKNEDEFKLSMKVSVANKFLIWTGILIVVISKILYYVFYEIFFVMSLCDIACSLGVTLFSAGLVSILVEISTIKNLVKNAMQNLLDGDIPLNSFSDEKLIEINKNIASKRGNINKNEIESSIYKLEPKIVDMLSDIYYKNYSMSYEVTPNEKNRRSQGRGAKGEESGCRYGYRTYCRHTE